MAPKIDARQRAIGNVPANVAPRMELRRWQPDDGADAFVHISAVERAGMRQIVEGQKIGFEMERDRKSGKMSACNLQAG